MANEIPVIPPDIRKVYLRVKRWRTSHARRVPIPESLWTAAGELARAHLRIQADDERVGDFARASRIDHVL
jgi:hypothetical protein